MNWRVTIDAAEVGVVCAPTRADAYRRATQTFDVWGTYHVAPIPAVRAETHPPSHHRSAGPATRRARTDYLARPVAPARPTPSSPEPLAASS